ncbi:MAG TPA: hypothetical protein VES59_10865 [Bacteroidota bacterium]|nr:hypothetical protein [Bacteroidota bacterium]
MASPRHQKVKEPAPTYVVDRKGKKTAVILPIQQYEELIDDLADLSAIAARKDEPTIPWKNVKRRLKKNGLLHD